MADVKVSALPVVTTSAAADSIPIVQGGVTSRIHPGPGGGLDADTVSGYGIGAMSAVPGSTDILGSTVQHGGKYYYDSTCTNKPSANDGVLEVIFLNTYMALFIATDKATGYTYKNVQTGLSTFTGWKQTWDALSDGNGGQPPAAKSNRTSNATIGWIDSVDCASGGTVTLPAGGTFETEVTTYGATYNSVKCAIVAGGAMTGTASANLTMRYKRLS